jgi:hypothetical protein
VIELRTLRGWHREGERWVIEDYIGEAAMRLESIGFDPPLPAIYARTALD